MGSCYTYTLSEFRTNSRYCITTSWDASGPRSREVIPFPADYKTPPHIKENPRSMLITCVTTRNYPIPPTGAGNPPRWSTSLSPYRWPVLNIREGNVPIWSHVNNIRHSYFQAGQEYKNHVYRSGTNSTKRIARWGLLRCIRMKPMAISLADPD